MTATPATATTLLTRAVWTWTSARTGTSPTTAAPTPSAPTPWGASPAPATRVTRPGQLTTAVETGTSAVWANMLSAFTPAPGPRTSVSRLIVLRGMIISVSSASWNMPEHGRELHLWQLLQIRNEENWGLWDYLQSLGL